MGRLEFIPANQRAATGRPFRRPLLGLVLVLALAAQASAPSPSGGGSPDSPNFLVILTDDQPLDSFKRSIMPRTFQALKAEGTYFRRSLAAPPLCCPYRAGAITGQYPQNHGVTTNVPGYPDLLEPEEVLPAWLDQAGYATSLVGKYLNGSAQATDLQSPPGWDEAYQLARMDYEDAAFAEDGERTTVAGYVTEAIKQRTSDVIERLSGPDEPPFFVWVGHLAPHGGQSISSHCDDAMPQPRGRAFKRYDGPRFAQVKRPSFNEADVSDKPPASRHPQLSADRKRQITKRWRCLGAALGELDAAVDLAVRELRAHGELDDTVIVFGSDNGFHQGEHRVSGGKGTIYEEALRVPLVMRVPSQFTGGAPAPDVVGELVSQVDLAPTMLELAGAEPCIAPGECRRLDGRSLVPLLQGDDSGWPRDRAIASYLTDDGGCTQLGLRTPTLAFGTEPHGCPNATELYFLRGDPFELKNVAKRRPGQSRGLEQRLRSLLDCSGIEGRDPPDPEAPLCE